MSSPAQQPLTSNATDSHTVTTTTAPEIDAEPRPHVLSVDLGGTRRTRAQDLTARMRMRGFRGEPGIGPGGVHALEPWQRPGHQTVEGVRPGATGIDRSGNHDQSQAGIDRRLFYTPVQPATPTFAGGRTPGASIIVLYAGGAQRKTPQAWRGRNFCGAGEGT